MDREPRQRTAALPFILITLFIDILGIGVIVPVLPELVKQLLEAEEIVAADPIAGEILELNASQSEVGEDEKYALAGRYVGVIAASYAFMQFIFANHGRTFRSFWKKAHHPDLTIWFRN